MNAEALARSAKFVATSCRDVEQALFARRFEGGTLDGFLDVLARYQNPDGGFGRGLENDVAAPASNPFATELALRACKEAETPPDHPLLRRTVEYIERTQHEDGDWRFTPDVYEHDLAPWFKAWPFPNLNPGCTTAGLLRDLGLGSARLHDRVEQLFQRLKRIEDVVEGQFYDVRPYAHYFLPEWEHPERELWISGVLWWHVRQHTGGKLEDSGHFFEYVRGPDTYLGRNLPRQIIEARLDMLEAEISEDGGWPSPYSDVWRGWFTVQNLLILQAFGRA